MAETQEFHAAKEERPKFNPWLFIPLLYFMQSIPVTIVQELSLIIYKDLGIENVEITRWTALIALPWSMQMLLGPFVDLNGTKRAWILGGQWAIAGGLAIAAFALQLPQAFAISLVAFGITAVFSALCNIATDGFALLSMTKTQQAAMAGFMSTFYRLGRLFCAALLVMIAGRFMALQPLDVKGADLKFEGSPNVQSGAKLIVEGGFLTNQDRKKLDPPIEVPPGSFKLAVDADGTVRSTTLLGEKEIGKLQPTIGASIPPVAVQGMDPRTAWTAVLGIALAVYVLGRLINQFTVPKPERDVSQEGPPGETQRNLIRTLALVGLGVGGYFTLNAMVRLSAHALWWSIDKGDPDGPLKGWKLPEKNLVLGFDLGLGPMGTEVAQLVVCTAVVAISLTLWKRMIAGSQMGEAIRTFVQQPGFPAIFFFILFYRFGEALVGRITPLFLKDAIDKGGLALNNEQLGFLNGVMGVVGIILGGIAGGLTVSKLGLRKAFVPLALAMHVPNLLYLGLSTRVLPELMVNVPGPGFLNMTVGTVLFVDQFGYGFGFAAYMVYLMWVAQRGKFTTSHYAIGTGMGALCIVTAGVLSGVLQKQLGYTNTFWAVILFSLPGMLSLLFIPLDDRHKEIKVEVD
jgi:PAT family beta-lactamase induction signal transducer AmpG